MAHFLKCENCGHFNLLKTEYLVFCESCQKKIRNNFYDWQKSNSGKTFEDFRNTVAVSEAEKQTTADPKKHEDKARTRILLILGFLVFSSIVFVAAKRIIDYMNSESDVAVESSSGWVRQELCSGFSLDVPGSMENMEFELPGEVKKYIRESKSYSLTTSEGSNIVLSCISYLPELTSISLDGAAQGAVNEMQNKPGVSDFTYEEKAVVISGIEGFVQRGKYNMLLQEFGFINCGFILDTQLWQVIIIYSNTNEEEIVRAEKIIQSIQINTGNKSTSN